jgi:hypothetical protein
MTQRERNRYRQLARLQSDPKNKILITKLIELWNEIKKATGFWQPRRAALLSLAARFRQLASGF